MKRSNAVYSSVNHDWRTPEDILARVRAVGAIRLDPCTSIENPTDAEFIQTAETNGLNKDWACDGLVYINPPYGRALDPWSKKIVSEVEWVRRGYNEMIALVPARPDTRWFNHMRYACDELAFATKRIKFVGADNSAPFPSAFFYYGTRIRRFRKAFEDLCWFVGEG